MLCWFGMITRWPPSASPSLNDFRLLVEANPTHGSVLMVQILSTRQRQRIGLSLKEIPLAGSEWYSMGLCCLIIGLSHTIDRKTLI
jgi:hypothetical protein